MKVFLIKGLMISIPLFILLGLIGNIIGMLIFYISRKIEKPINSYLNLLIYISFIIGAVCFSFIGMFYAAYTFALAEFVKNWIAILLVILYIVALVYFFGKEQSSIRAKTLRYNESDFYSSGIAPYLKNIEVTNVSILNSSFLLILSYIFFLIFPNLIEKLSFGVVSYLISFIN